MTTCEKLIKELKAQSDPEAVKMMARFGINPKKWFGLTVAAVRKFYREYGGKQNEVESYLYYSKRQG